MLKAYIIVCCYTSPPAPVIEILNLVLDIGDLRLGYLRRFLVDLLEDFDNFLTTLRSLLISFLGEYFFWSGGVRKGGRVGGNRQEK